MFFGVDEDTWTPCEFTPGPASRLGLSLIGECAVDIQSELRRVVPPGTHELCIGKIMAVQEDYQLRDEACQMHIGAGQLLAQVSGAYHRVGDAIASEGLSQRPQPDHLSPRT